MLFEMTGRFVNHGYEASMGRPIGFSEAKMQCRSCDHIWIHAEVVADPALQPGPCPNCGSSGKYFCSVREVIHRIMRPGVLPVWSERRVS